MQQNEIIVLLNAIKKIQKITKTDPSEIIDALIGIAWDEETSGQLKYRIRTKIINKFLSTK